VPQELREALRRTSPGMKRFDDTRGTIWPSLAGS
jgi:hypothetical protein